MRSPLFLLGSLAIATAALPAHAEVRLPAIFGSHMVVQRDVPLPVWGWAAPGEEVKVTLAGRRQETKAGEDGKWRVTLEPVTTAGPHQMEVAGTNRLQLEDVLAGEVWLCSGQSNMAMTVSASKDFPQERAAAEFPQIRVFTVIRSAQPIPQEDVRGEWVVCSPATVGNFSATGYFFGREIHQQTKAPVGVINSSWGGTDIAAWTSEPAQKPVEAIAPLYQEWEQLVAKYEPAAAQVAYEKAKADFPAKVEAARAAGQKSPPRPEAPHEPRIDQNYPANLFNGMINGLIPYPIKGTIWYQGEHNTYRPDRAARYETQLRLLVQDWRQRWGTEFPFAWVQLPNFAYSPVGRVQVREACLKCLDMPKTGMAVTIDIGESKDNHPKNKQAVGHRLAQWALGSVYKLPVAATSGPLPAGYEVRGNEISLRFTHAEGGLQARGEELQGFMVAGADKVWKPAQARINGNYVIVFSPEVNQPVAARYAFEGDPVCNLYNGAGLPATPFRTDDWPLQ